MHRRGMMGCAGVVVCFLVLAAGISAENKQDVDLITRIISIKSPFTPEEEYMKHVDVTLLRKDWKPSLLKMPNHDQELPSYPGSAIDASDTFRNEDIIYSAYQKPLDDNPLELLTGDYGYDKSLDSIFIVIGSNETQSIVNQNIALALAMRNRVKHYNVFTFNVKSLGLSIAVTSLKQFVGAELMYPALAKKISTFFDSAIKAGLMEVNQIHIVGFCWAAVFSGFLAKEIKKQHKKGIKSLVALDPFSQGVSSIANEIFLADDAEVVNVYHTNSIIMGSLRRRSTLDIVFNSGFWQPGCDRSDFMCSHWRAAYYLFYIILYPEQFVARKCDSWVKFYFCLCNEEKTFMITYPPPTDAVGSFYLNTIAMLPFGIGEDGVACSWTRTESNVDIIKDDK